MLFCIKKNVIFAKKLILIIMKSYHIILSVALLFASVTAIGQEPQQVTKAKSTMAAPTTIVYKVAKKYVNKVPITLSSDKKQIVSYPDPKDINENSAPTPLKKGYYLDNRGINANSVFISLTYDEYAKLKSPPSLEQLNKLILNDNPIKKMYDCGSRFQYENIIEELLLIIDKKFVNCKRIK